MNGNHRKSSNILKEKKLKKAIKIFKKRKNINSYCRQLKKPIYTYKSLFYQLFHIDRENKAKLIGYADNQYYPANDEFISI